MEHIVLNLIFAKYFEKLKKIFSKNQQFVYNFFLQIFRKILSKI